MTLLEILDAWDTWEVVAVLRCNVCGRKLGTIRDTPDGNVVRVGRNRTWTPPETYADDPSAPGALFSPLPRWGLAGFCGDTPDQLYALFPGLPPAWCSRCDEGCAFNVEPVS